MARTPWHEVDPGLRAAVEEMLGAAVTDAVSQPGGFSPGSADRITLADGRRAFVKSATDAVNADVVRIHRSEAAVAAALPPDVPAPAFWGSVDRGDRIAVVFADVEARHPETPWRGDDLAAVLDALAVLTARPVPPSPALADFSSAAAEYARGWALLGDGLPALPPDLDGWIRAELPRLIDASARMSAATRGDRLVHHDLRADNVLLLEDGSAVLIDWPWGARGAGWVDALTLLFNVRYFDPSADVEAVIASHAVFAGVRSADADAVLAGLAGHFLHVSQQPAVPGIPTLRAFQYDQAVAILRWVRERWTR